MAIKKIRFGFYGLLGLSKPCALREEISLSNCNSYEIISCLPRNRGKKHLSKFASTCFLLKTQRKVFYLTAVLFGRERSSARCGDGGVARNKCQQHVHESFTGCDQGPCDRR